MLSAKETLISRRAGSRYSRIWLNTFCEQTLRVLPAYPFSVRPECRPARWSDAAILEEHAFVATLVEREIPVVPALAINDHTLHSFNGFRFAVFPKHGGRAPELDNRATLEWMGRFIGRIHAVGALAPYRDRPTLDIQSFGEEPSAYLLTHDFLPPDLIEVYRGVVAQALG